MSFPRDVSGKPLFLAPEGAYLDGVFAPINTLVCGKRYRWVLSHSLETLSLEGMMVALGCIGWKVLSRSTSHESYGYFGPVTENTLSRLWRKPDTHFPVRDLRRAVKCLLKLFNLKDSNKEPAYCLAHCTFALQKFSIDLIFSPTSALSHRWEVISSTILQTVSSCFICWQKLLFLKNKVCSSLDFLHPLLPKDPAERFVFMKRGKIVFVEWVLKTSAECPSQSWCILCHLPIVTLYNLDKIPRHLFLDIGTDPLVEWAERGVWPVVWPGLLLSSRAPQCPGSSCCSYM